MTKGKYNLLLEALLNNGQSILVSKLFDEQNFIPKTDEQNEIETLLQLANDKLKAKTFEKLREFIGNQKKLAKGQFEILLALIKNED